MSIGVSNFDEPLLNELKTMATVLPHAVQNWADQTHFDLPVRQWCTGHNVVYQPYATLRNLNSLDRRIYNILVRIAREKKSTVQAVSLQFFFQTGCGMIPRSSKKQVTILLVVCCCLLWLFVCCCLSELTLFCCAFVASVCSFCGGFAVFLSYYCNYPAVTLSNCFDTASECQSKRSGLEINRCTNEGAWMGSGRY